MTSDLITLTQAAFAPGGPLETALKAAKRPYKPNPTQQAYAVAVAKTFLAGRDTQDRAAVSLLEAETGTGKSLGYLVPLCLALALRGDRGLVATHTHQLMAAVVEREAPIAIAVAKALTGVTLVVAQRLGVRAWLSPIAIETLIEALREENSADARLPALDSLLAYAKDPTSTGTLRGWLDENDDLPLNVTPAEVTLVSSRAKDAGAYLRHVEDTHKADLLVVSHALLAVDLMRNLSVLGDASTRPLALAVVDEGDQLPSALESVLTTNISVPMLTRLAESLEGPAQPKLLAAIHGFAAFMGKVRRENPSVERTRFMRLSSIAGEAYVEEARKHAAAVRAALDWVPVGASSRALTDADEWSDGLADFMRSLEGKATHLAASLSWSPALAYPTFSVVPLRASRMVDRALKPARTPSTSNARRSHLHAMVITSATLGDPGSKVAPFKDYQDALGLYQDHRDWAHYLETISDRFAPEKFGKLKFAVSKASAPKPPKLNDDGSIDVEALNAWRRYVVDVTTMAHEKGGRTLVLATSYMDVEAIGAMLNASGINAVVQSRDSSFQDLIRKFTDAPNAVFVTLRWEGLDLPGLISHVVISRIPFAPVGELSRKIAKQEMIDRGYDESKADGILLANAARVSRSRLKQGIGRAIRQASDKATIWFADSRFPRPAALIADRTLKAGSNQGFFQPFAGSIPVRFRHGAKETYGSSHLIPFQD